MSFPGPELILLRRSKLHSCTQDMYDGVPVPQSLQEGHSFDFLRRDLRQTASSLAGSDS